MEQKKQTRAQIERRLERAVLHIDRTKETKEFYFSDKGLKLIVTEDYAIVETSFHRHVFSNITSSGVSRPYLYVKRFIEITEEHDDKIIDNFQYSYTKLFEVLKKEENKAEYNIATYFDWWCFNCFVPLYSIGESDAEAFLVYEDYLHNIARNVILLSEKVEDMTNKQFFEKVVENMKTYISEIDEVVVFKKKSDDEVMKESVEALQEQELNQTIEQENNGAE